MPFEALPSQYISGIVGVVFPQTSVMLLLLTSLLPLYQIFLFHSVHKNPN